MTHDLLSRRSFLQGMGGLLATSPIAHALHGLPHHRPRARSVIFLGQLGAPSHIDLFDPKPLLVERDGQEMPESLVKGQPLDQIQDRRLVIAGSRFRFQPSRGSGVELSELLPHLAGITDRIALVRSMHTDVINHNPAQTMLLTGHPRPGRPSLGSWVLQGLDTPCPDLPGFVTLNSGSNGDPVPSTLWGNAFLPGEWQGVQFLPGAHPVPYLEDPAGLPRASRRARLEALVDLNELQQRRTNDPAIRARNAASELAFRMQESVPDLLDLEQETEETRALYGIEGGQPSYAANCLLARRMVERGVRFVQLMHIGWDHHEQLPRELPRLCAETDRASAALILDLERRGLLEDTLVVWAGEFGRTPMQQGGRGGMDHGRDHHGKAFSIWLAGGGVRPGTVIGATDDFGYGVTEDPVHVHDLHATLLHLLGIDHTRLTFRHEGRDYRLTDVAGNVVESLLA